MRGMKNKNRFNTQRKQWETTFSETEDLFGDAPSAPARIAAALFKKEGVARLLELGAGQGRDTLFFARQGFDLTALDYSAAGLRTIEEKSRRHDFRQALPFADGAFDACYSHMLFCMALWHSPRPNWPLFPGKSGAF